MRPKVAVITRTRNRPVLLQRTYESVLGQAFKDFIWVLVNDAGEPSLVDAVAHQAEGNGLNVSVIHRKKSTGIEAASNAGIRGSDSKYIVIVDDDDSLHPLFLQKTVSFLEEKPHYKGVVTQVYRVDEEINEDAVSVLRRTPWNPGLRSVCLGELAASNIWPPVSFLYHRAVAEEVGLYNESLPVLADWYFNLLFLEKYDIGVIPECLANYHFRSANHRRFTCLWQHCGGWCGQTH